MSEIYYSLIKNAKMYNLDVHKHLDYILEEIQEKGVGLEYKKYNTIFKQPSRILKTKLSARNERQKEVPIEEITKLNI